MGLGGRGKEFGPLFYAKIEIKEGFCEQNSTIEIITQKLHNVNGTNRKGTRTGKKIFFSYLKFLCSMAVECDFPFSWSALHKTWMRKMMRWAFCRLIRHTNTLNTLYYYWNFNWITWYPKQRRNILQPFSTIKRERDRA